MRRCASKLCATADADCPVRQWRRLGIAQAEFKEHPLVSLARAKGPQRLGRLRDPGRDLQRGLPSVSRPDTHARWSMPASRRRMLQGVLSGKQTCPSSSEPHRTDPEARLVGVVSAHPLAAEYLRLILSAKWRVEVCSPAATHFEVPILVVDAGVPCMRALVHLLANGSVVKMVVVDQIRSPADLVPLLASGIQAFISYENVGTSLVQAVDTAAQGGLWWPDDVMMALIAERPAGGARRSTATRPLTKAEGEIAQLLARGRPTNKEISRLLGISARTVRFHLANIFMKLGVHDRYSLSEIFGGIPGGAGQEMADRPDSPEPNQFAPTPPAKS